MEQKEITERLDKIISLLDAIEIRLAGVRTQIDISADHVISNLSQKQNPTVAAPDQIAQ